MEKEERDYCQEHAGDQYGGWKKIQQDDAKQDWDYKVKQIMRIIEKGNQDQSGDDLADTQNPAGELTGFFLQGSCGDEGDQIHTADQPDRMIYGAFNNCLGGYSSV